MSEVKDAFKLFTDKESRDKLIAIIKSNPIGGLFIGILIFIVQYIVLLIQDMQFTNTRDFVILSFYTFLILVSVVIIIFSMRSSSSKAKSLLEDDRLENRALAQIEANKEIEIEKIEAKLKEAAYQKELDDFAMLTHEEQKKYQLYLIANQSSTLYEELSALVSNIIFLSETVVGPTATVTHQLENARNRMRDIVQAIGRLPKFVEMTFKEFLLVKSGVDLDGDGVYESIADEIRDISKKLGGKLPIQTEAKPPTPTKVENDEDSISVLVDETKEILKN